MHTRHDTDTDTQTPVRVGHLTCLHPEESVLQRSYFLCLILLSQFGFHPFDEDSCCAGSAENLAVRIFVLAIWGESIDAVMAEYRSFSFSKMIGCWSCFGLIKKQRRRRTRRGGFNNFLSQGLLVDGEPEGDEVSYSGDGTSHTTSGDDNEVQNLPNRSEEILNFRAENGMVCRSFPVKETYELVRSEVSVGITFLYWL